MPRKAGPPYLWLDPARNHWVIRDGSAVRIRTGLNSRQKAEAQERLQDYIVRKYKPAPSPAPLIADVLIAYEEHRPQERLTISNLKAFWAEKTTNEINARTCREYAKQRPPVAARRDLETMRAAVNYWHKEYHHLDRLPAFTMPPKPEPREGWLTKGEVARLLWAARKTPHLARFIIIGFYTGSRTRAILDLKWSWVDMDLRIMRRRAPGTPDKRTKRRTPVRIGSRLLAHLRRWKRLDGEMEYVIHYDGKPVRKLRRSWAGAAKRAGVEATPHVLRHTRATLMLKEGISKTRAAEFLGMSEDVLDRVYGHFHPDWQEEAAEV